MNEEEERVKVVVKQRQKDGERETETGRWTIKEGVDTQRERDTHGKDVNNCKQVCTATISIVITEHAVYTDPFLHMT